MDAALASQVEANHADAFAWAVACCNGNREEAEDVLQTTYLKLAEGKATFGGRSTFKTWLFGVIRNTARERRRRRGSRLALLEKWTVEPAPAPTPDVDVEASEQALLLQQALKELSDRQREVLELVFYHDMTIEESAGVMEVSLGTARTHYDRGKKAMAAKVAALRG